MAALVALRELARTALTGDELPDEIGWVEWLSSRHQRLFAIELRDALENADAAELEEFLDAWKATAEIDHSPEIRSVLESNRGRDFERRDEWPKSIRRTA